MSDNNPSPEDASHQRRTIGNMNGPWAILLRIALATYPLVLAWGIWVTVQTFENQAFRNAGDRFSKADALMLKADILALHGQQASEQNKYLSSISDRLVRIETILRDKP